ncbi:MAG: hypothetical protein K2P87_07440 [Lachnospiraceae bacterium]|nr:hypothetical protein [Lachnospiraceae bacterium]
MRRRKRKQQQEEQALNAKEALRQLKRSKKGLSREEAAQIVGVVCEQMEELGRQAGISQREYEAVTSYLTDMQKIERMDPAARQNLNDAARNIINLTKERVKYQNSSDRVPVQQYRAMERYEREIPDALKNIYEQEQYREMIHSDLRQLDGERAVIEYEKESAADKKIFLRNLAFGAGFLVVFLFLTLLAMNMITGTDMLLPMLLVLALAAGTVAYITAAAGRCGRVLHESDYKLNRVIQLTNKVKIKLVNCTNALDYAYEKYQVESYRELTAVWEKYVHTKDEERRYKKSTELLEHYNRELMDALLEEEVKDAEIWLYQAEALLDEKEMVEVRHHLNIRRQKIRERLEFNNEQLAMCREELSQIAEGNSAYADLVGKIAGEHGISW